MNKILFYTIAILLYSNMFSQVGIGTTDPQSVLDIRSSNQTTPLNTDGLLIPKVDQFSGTNPTATQHGMLVQLTTTDGTDTPGFYYWNNPTTTWLPLTTVNVGWSLTGNAATNATTNFLGTTDLQDFVIRTNNTEKIRVLTDGNTGIGINNPTARLVANVNTANNFTTIKANGSYDAQGYLGAQGADNYDGITTADWYGLEIGVIGISTGASSTDNIGVLGHSNSVSIRAEHTNGTNWAELGTTNYSGLFNGRVEMNAASDASGTTGTGILEIDNSLRLDGNEIITNSDTVLYMQNGNNGDLRVDSSTFSVDASTNRVGVGDITPDAKLEVYSSNTTERGLAVRNVNGAADGAMILQQGTGNGLYVQASSSGAHGINAGSGGYLTNTSFTTSGPHGLNNFGEQAGVSGAGLDLGIIGCAQNIGSTTQDKAGGWFYVQNNGSNPDTMAVVGAVVNNTNYKILGNGVVSTIVMDHEDNKRIMVAPEAPEALFEDYGTGKLTNGKAHIKIDPILAKNILVDSKHPLRVFVQLEGNCNGVYVTNKTGTSFDIVELNNGNSNIVFSYQIVASRADETINGKTSKYSEMRFKKLDWKAKKLNNNPITEENNNVDENFQDKKTTTETKSELIPNTNEESKN